MNCWRYIFLCILYHTWIKKWSYINTIPIFFHSNILKQNANTQCSCTYSLFDSLYFFFLYPVKLGSSNKTNNHCYSIWRDIIKIILFKWCLNRDILCKMFIFSHAFVLFCLFVGWVKCVTLLQSSVLYKTAWSFFHTCYCTILNNFEIP